MTLRSNPIPKNYVVLCKGPRSKHLIEFNKSLRDVGIDARYRSLGGPEAEIKVPPEAFEQSAQLSRLYTKTHPELRSTPSGVVGA